MLTLRIIEFFDEMCPFFAIIFDAFHEDEIFWIGPFFIELGVEVVEPSFSAIFARFVVF